VEQSDSQSSFALDDGKLYFLPHGPAKRTKQYIPNIWLRDHCQCEQCFHPSTKQRLIETFDDIPEDVQISEKAIIEDSDGFQISWKDGHQSYYTKSYLNNKLLDRDRLIERQGLVNMTLWAGDDIKTKPPTIEYDAIMASDDGVKDWTHKIREYGFCYVNNCPITPEATQTLLERIAFIRHTHYGGFYDFTADLSKGDTAYTQLGIGAHTDNTYFSEPAGLQMFHLLSHTDGEGGVSQLVDGFAAAKLLFEEDPESYATLRSTNIYSHASGNEDSSIQPLHAYPTLVHDPIDNHLVQVRWNTTDRARIDTSIPNLDRWYKAARLVSLDNQ
jgi:trimethyllysine dioxygenase